ncbi:pentatricopeptide repeat-containing protein At2g13600-like [Selaginella moellendorffii]|uniref:pentatricopeptide repeat-containing protein At2g13600-like n=1 Tax=Selaginella moellendorffii TaxID=88036 RepID=UPI000D1CB612|nr:pentatricopeptide repeat-containing protein At2g13600-like [Selaginella moellendorffii]|eukprot:XP_024529084.1 pentatricopeptide repeat-containing protein At2g13600-like [Selaginella moellendorffii]
MHFLRPALHRYCHRLGQCRAHGTDCSAELLSGLKSCGSSKDLEKGRVLHDRAIQSGVCSNLYVSCSLIGMYGRCGSLVEARRVFDRMPCHNVVAWNAFILGHAENGEESRALEAFSWMESQGCAPDAGTFFAAIKACSARAVREEARLIGGKMIKLEALEQGMRIHSRAKSSGKDDHVASSLVEMYACCGRMVEARMVFDTSSRHSVISWTVLVLGYVANGESELALEVFGSMGAGEIKPDGRCFGAAVKACSGLAGREKWGEDLDGTAVKVGALRKGREIHRQARRALDVFVGNALVDMFATCGSMVDARGVFDKMPCHSVVSWNTLLVGYVENGEAERALESFASATTADSLTFVAGLKACIGLAAKEEATSFEGKMVKVDSLDKGMAIHIQAAEKGFERDEFLSNTLVDMYAKCGSMVEAERVFRSMPCHGLVSWTALMLGYVDNSQAGVALDLFSQMKNSGLVPDAMALVAVSKACLGLAAKEGAVVVDGKLVKLKCLERTMALHGDSRNYFKTDVILASTLVDAYARNGSLLDARRVFDQMCSHDGMSWTSLVLACVDCGEEDTALELFQHMISEGYALTSSSIVTAALKACIRVAAREEAIQVDGKAVKVSSLQKGIAIHCQASELLRHWDFVLASSLMEMYAKCGSLVDAQRVFDSMPHRDVVSWTVLMSGYADCGDGDKVLELFAGMKLKLGQPCCALDARVFVPVLKGSSSVGSLEVTKAIVGEVYRYGAEKDIVLSNSMVDVFGKAGSMNDAQQAFDAAQTRDLIAWNALAAGYGRQGDAEKVLDVFHRAVDDEGVEPDSVTLLCVLAACSHAGMVTRGRKYFDAMLSKYGVSPRCEHRVCVVDMLGRANQLGEALVMVTSMGSEARALTWRTLLAACRTWRDVETGKVAFESLVNIDDRDTAAYSLMSNLLGSVGLWQEQSRILRSQEELFAQQQAVASYIDCGELVKERGRCPCLSCRENKRRSDTIARAGN